MSVKAIVLFDRTVNLPTARSDYMGGPGYQQASMPEVGCDQV